MEDLRRKSDELMIDIKKIQDLTFLHSRSSSTLTLILKGEVSCDPN